MTRRYALQEFTDGAIPVYLVVDPDTGKPLTDGNLQPFQSISPNVLRRLVAHWLGEWIEVALTSDVRSDATDELRDRH